MLTDKITAPTCVRGEDLYDEDQPWVSHLFLGGIELRHCALMVVWLSVALYVAAFAVPYDIQSYGFGIFLIGLIWCWAVNLTYSWWANVLYWVALVYFCRGQWPRAAIWGLLAMALGGAFALEEPRTVWAPAFLVWVASMAVLGGGSFGLAICKNRQT
jgi:hypothetical protein